MWWREKGELGLWVEVKLQKKKKKSNMHREESETDVQKETGNKERLNADDFAMSASSPFLRPVSGKIVKDWNEQKKLLGVWGLTIFELFPNSVNCGILTVMQMNIAHKNASCVMEVHLLLPGGYCPVLHYL